MSKAEDKTIRALAAVAVTHLALFLAMQPQTFAQSKAPPPSPANLTPLPGERFKFAIKMGAEVPVCKAYLQRLNRTLFHRPPYCGRPETHQVAGFEYLHRVRLKQKEIDRLSPMATSLFTQQPISPPWKSANRSKYMPSSWRYAPRIDIDNDGVADNIVVWDSEDVDDPSCGMPYGPSGVLGRGGQFGLVLSPDGLSIDEAQTNLVFGQLGLDPVDASRAIHPKGYDNFQPIGVAMGVFRYSGETYFDTFFDTTYREGALGPTKMDPNLEDTLGVFLRRDGVTRQVCEYHLTVPPDER